MEEIAMKFLDHYIVWEIYMQYREDIKTPSHY